MLSFPQILDNARQSHPPFSFRIGDRPAEFQFQRERQSSPTERTLVFQVKDTPLLVILETKEIPEAGVLTLHWRFLARGSVRERINTVYAWDLALPGKAQATLHGWTGGYVYRNGKNMAHGTYPPNEFSEWSQNLSEKSVELEDRDGRCSTLYLPFWMLQHEDTGFWLAPEWSGSWDLKAAAENDAARLQFGLPCLDFEILQGEEISMPAITCGTYQGTWRDGCVALRRAIRDHFMPTHEGKTPVPAAEVNFINGSRPELDQPGVEREVHLARALGLENFVWAAGWFRPPNGLPSFLTDEEIAELFPHFANRAAYEQFSFWESSGPYVAKSEERFGGDLPAFSKRLDEMGIRHGLWYDPRMGYKLPEYEENQDGLIPPAMRKPQDKGYSEGHFDMSSRAGRKLLEDALDRMVNQYGARYIWHDLNTQPRSNYWEEYEQEGRRGLTELLHYNASDEFYDRFLKEHPDVWIMWCGGGGSMINLGVLRRCHSLWIADNNDYSTEEEKDANTDINRAYRTSLNWIMPSSYITNFLSASMLYKWRDHIGMRDLLALMGGCFTIHGPLVNLNVRDHADIARAVGLFKSVRHFFTKDFWSLFPPTQDRLGWDGWQFHDAETGSGILLFFKRRDCGQDTREVELKWVREENPEAPLQIGIIEGDAQAEELGGSKIRITMATDAVLLRYDTEERKMLTESGLGMMTT